MCHVLGMSSACANPVIYGFLNENFSKEFRLIWQWWNDRIKNCIRFLFPGLIKPDDPGATVVEQVVIINDADLQEKDTISNAVELKIFREKK